MPVLREGSYEKKVMKIFLLLITISQCKKNEISSCDNETSVSTDNEYPDCSDTFNTDRLSGDGGTSLSLLIFLLSVMFLSGVLAIFSNGFVILAKRGSILQSTH